MYIVRLHNRILLHNTGNSNDSRLYDLMSDIFLGRIIAYLYLIPERYRRTKYCIFIKSFNFKMAYTFGLDIEHKKGYRYKEFFHTKYLSISISNYFMFPSIYVCKPHYSFKVKITTIHFDFLYYGMVFKYFNK